MLEFHILIHFLRGCGKSLRLRQLKKDHTRDRKQNPNHMKSPLQFKLHALGLRIDGLRRSVTILTRSRVKGVPTLMQFGRLSNATETMIPVTSRSPLPVVSSSPRTYCQIYRVLHATGKHDGIPQRLPHQCVCPGSM